VNPPKRSLDGAPGSIYSQVMMFQALLDRGFQCRFESHAGAILDRDFPDAAMEISAVLQGVDVPITEIIGSGGGETKGTQRMRKGFADALWRKKNYEIRKIINGVERESISHEVDHVKTFPNGELALEIEWNNKDPFFDRDLENFKRLHNEGAISLGIIVTRGETLHERMSEFVQRFAEEQGIWSFGDLERLNIFPTLTQKRQIEKWISRRRDALPFPDSWRKKFVADKYSSSTTHWRKLMDRVQRGVGNPCPLLLVGLPDSIVSFPEQSASTVAAAIERASIENAETPADIEPS